MNEDEIVLQRPSLQCEFGCSEPLRWANQSMVTMYDSDGKEIVIPKCEICGCHKAVIIGNGDYNFVCPLNHEK